MITINLKPNYKSWRKQTSLILGAFATAFIFSACGSSSSNNNPVISPYGTNGIFGQNCTVSGCVNSAGAQVVGMGMGEMTYMGTPALQLELQFVASGAGVIAQGRLLVATAFVDCGVPAGQYTVQSTTPGQFTQAGTFQAQLVAVGAGQIPIAISGTLQPVSPNAIAADGTSFSNRLNGRMQMGNCGANLMY